MSRTRTRPTREETRERLFEAAAGVFEDRGIGAASIEAIAEAAGFTRGAFYSNFAGKDDLIVAMLEDHVERSLDRYRQLLLDHRDPVDFVAALRDVDRNQQDPLGRSPLLHMELILFVARAEARRPELAERLRARRALIAEVIDATGMGADLAPTPGGGSGPGPTPVDGALSWAAILLALEDGFRLHRLIDPDTTPADSFLRAVAQLQQALGIGEGRPQ